MNSLDRKLSPLITLGTLLVVVVIVYWGKPVLMPLTLAVLLSFLLNPIVNALHRRRLPRAAAVMVVVLLLFSVVAGISWAIAHQMNALAGELPLYRQNVVKKITELRTAGKGTAFEKMQKAVNDVMNELRRQHRVAEDAARTDLNSEPSAEKKEVPLPVVVQEEKHPRRLLPAGLGPLIEGMATTVVVLVLIIFILLRQQQLRNRLIRLIGYSRMTTTTKALDEAGARISRYLLMQSAINATFGSAVAAGLFLLGLPYAILWGFLAGALRFIPYVGPWLGASMPFALSLAVFDGWAYSFLVIALFVVLELVTNMILEPLLYGQSAGVSEVALLVAIAFWTWVWGPVGIVLATPLTVCFVVLCKYIPELEFVELLMGDEPVMDPQLIYYQRLLAGDQDEAVEVVQQYLKDHPVERVFDEVLIPALVFLKRDAARDKVSEDDQQFIVKVTRELVENLEINGAAGAFNPQIVDQAATSRSCRVLALPARDQMDEVALLMLRQLLGPKPCHFEIISSEMLSAEMLNTVAEQNAGIICIGAMPPDAIAPTRYLCKRLRERFPDAKILVGRWGFTGDRKEDEEHLSSVGAAYVGTSLVETRTQLLHALQTQSCDLGRSRSNSSLERAAS